MIELLNVKEGDIFKQSLVYLFGKSYDTSQSSIQIFDHFGTEISWKIVNNYFKVI